MKPMFWITATGRDLMTRAAAGEMKIEITRAMIGVGTMNPEQQNPKDLIDLVMPYAAAAITEPIITHRANSDEMAFKVQYRSDMNGGLENDIVLREVGVYALDQNSVEKLIYYGNLFDYSEDVRAWDGAVSDVREYPIVIAVSDAANITVSCPALAFMTSDETHNYFMNIALPIANDNAAALIAVHNASPQSHPDIRNLIERLTGRVSRLEDMFRFDVTTNPFTFAFDNLVGFTVTGVWNKELQRIEF